MPYLDAEEAPSVHRDNFSENMQYSKQKEDIKEQ